MDHKEVYNQYSEKLLLCLPMDDVTFIAKLSSHNLTPGDVKGEINAKSTQAKKASYFLDTMIERPLKIGEYESFNELLSVMIESNFKHLVNLASEIKSKIKVHDQGLCLCMCYS